MTDIGYTLSSEEFDPNELVSVASSAEEAGFDFLSISDHFHPWLDEQGESPFVWSTLGGVAQATDRIDVGVGVTCPTIRIHPVNVAQATATVATMLDGRRFYFGVGTGELLNEHVTGAHWPDHAVRLEMLEEAVEVIRKLWTGEQTSHHGKHYDVQNARLYTLPEENPTICVSAYGPRAATAAARIGDGFWASGPQGTIETWEEEGGEGPRLCQLHACVADSEDEAVQTAHEHWRNSALPGELGSQLPTPEHFEQATQIISEEDIREGSIITEQDPQAHIDSIQQALDQGYDKVYVHQIGDEQEKCIELYEEEVLPTFD